MKKLFLLFACSLFVILCNSQNICLTSLEQEVINLINIKRVENGINQLYISPILMITANKNVEEIVTESYLSHKPSEFGEYTEDFGQIRYTSTASDASKIVNSLTSVSSFNNYRKIILNTDEFSTKNWTGIGICIRSTNVVIIVGEREQERIDLKICDTEQFFTAPAAINYPILSLFIPELSIVEVYGSLHNGGDVQKIEIDELKTYIDYGQILKIKLDYPVYESFDVYIKPSTPSIVPIGDILITVKSDEKSIIEKDIEFKGNSVGEINEYLRAGGNVNDVYKFDANAYTMLQKAVMHDDIDAVKFLVEKGAGVNVLSADKENALSFVRSSEMFDYLRTLNPDYKVPNSDNITLLHTYSIINLLEPVKFLVEKQGFDVNATDRSGGTPLIYAVQFKSYEVAEYLLSKGAIQSKGWGIYPIHDAVMNNDFGMLKLLVKYGADINSKDDDGYTPLHKALNYTDGNDEVIEYLRKLGAHE